MSGQASESQPSERPGKKLLGGLRARAGRLLLVSGLLWGGAVPSGTDAWSAGELPAALVPVWASAL